MGMVRGWLKTENNAVAKGFCGPALPADGDSELMSRLSTAALTVASKMSEALSTVLKRHLGLNPGWATSIRLFEMLSAAVNSTEHI